jgi:hypothetical protein
MTRTTTTRCEALLGAALTAALALVSTGCAAAGSNAVNPVVMPAAATISVCNQTEQGCSTAAAFSLSNVRDLSVDVQWQHLDAGTHTQTLELLEPGGGTYQVQNTSFLIANGNDGAAKTNVAIPLAGSWVTQRVVTGSWSVRISLDGQNISTTPVVFQP